MARITAQSSVARSGPAPGRARPALQPTDEQAAILESFRHGGDLVIEAGAGTGKTSTLRMLADSDARRRGVYLAFNRAIAEDAKNSFPWWMKCATAHSFAFRAVGNRYGDRLNGPRLPARQTAEILRIRGGLEVAPGKWLRSHQLARLVMETVTLFCYSAEREIEPWHVAPVVGLEDNPQARSALEETIVPLARAAWVDLQAPNGRLKFTHDHYLKLWQLSNPSLNADYVFLDEAQDANPVIADVVRKQASQIVLVGDRSQQIYQWRGAVDAMETFGYERYPLSQSFRFGDAIAEEANKWLSLLEAPLRLRGLQRISSSLDDLSEPRAVLCRTNAETVARALDCQLSGRMAALVGDGIEIRRLALAAIPLKQGQACEHPELFLFQDWAELQEFVEHDKGGADLKTFVHLIDRWTPEVVIQAVDALVPESEAEIIISTAHKAKGREWPTVKIATDFERPEEGQKIEPAEARLAYVAVTRAQQTLDRSGLSWVDDWLRRLLEPST